MSRVSRALREIDARRASAPMGARHSVNLLRAYAGARGLGTSGERVHTWLTKGWPPGSRRVAWAALVVSVVLLGAVLARAHLAFLGAPQRVARASAVPADAMPAPDPTPAVADAPVAAVPEPDAPEPHEATPVIRRPESNPVAGESAKLPNPTEVKPPRARRGALGMAPPEAELDPARESAADAVAPPPAPRVAPVPRGARPVPARPEREQAPTLQVQPRTESVEWLQAQARAALAAGDTQEALQALRSALRQDPLAHTARQALLAVLARGERGPVWVAALSEAAAIDAARFGLVAARGLAEAGRSEEALQALVAMPLSSRTLEWYATHGVLAQRAGHHERAIESLFRALELAGPGSLKRPALQIALAESLSARGQTELALQHLAELAGSEAVSAELRAVAARRLKALR